MDDEAIAAYAQGNEADYDRRVLGLLVQEEVYAVAAERYDVRVTDAQVRSRIDELLGEDDPDTIYGGLAQQGISREDVFENVRQLLIRTEIALAAGDVEVPSEEELRATYEEVKQDQVKYRFGYITVPDQRTADRVVDALNADPDRYEALAERYAGTYTISALESRPLDQIPGPLAQQAADAEPGTAFAVPVEETGGIVVGFVGPPPSFEELRPQLQQQAESDLDQAAQPLITKVREDLDVVVNPRYGVLEDTGELVPGGGGVVQILEDQEAAETAEGGADGGAAE
jgi:peptidyl-prolyl cis-trans isomerase SurA